MKMVYEIKHEKIIYIQDEEMSGASSSSQARPVATEASQARLVSSQVHMP